MTANDAVIAGLAMAMAFAAELGGVPHELAVLVIAAMGSGISAGFRALNGEFKASHWAVILLNWVSGIIGGISLGLLIIGIFPFISVAVEGPLIFWTSLVAAMFVREMAMFQGAGEIIDSGMERISKKMRGDE